MDDGCEADLSDLDLPDSTKVGPLPEIMVDGVRVWDLRQMKNVIIQKGIEKIGNHWFWCCGVESIEIPASVRKIGANAFYKCESLKQVTFVEGSLLERIGEACFSGSGITEISIPSNVTIMGNSAFSNCESLKRIIFAERSRLEKISECCFQHSGIESITIP